MTGLVGIVVVSHSRALADAAVELASEMVHGTGPRIAVAAGLDERTLGTDAVQVFQAITSVDSEAGVVVLLDLGSAILSAELALDLLEENVRGRVLLSPAPLVEGLVAAVVTAAGGAGAAEVAAEATAALAGKQAHLSAPAADVTEPATVSGADARGVFLVRNPNGLHARPAARLVAVVRTLDAQVQLTNLSTGRGPVPASSLSRVATLGALHGHEVEVRVTGSQASEALEQILALAARQFDEVAGVELAEAGPPVSTGAPVPVSPGIAIGATCQAESPELAVPTDEPGEPATQWRRLREAIAAARRDISLTRARVSHQSGDAEGAIFAAHLMLLDDTALLEDAHQRIGGGAGAAAAWDAAVRRVVEEFRQLEDEYLRARAADVTAVGQQVLRYLVGSTSPARPLTGVVISSDLGPADVADLQPGAVAGIVLANGSPTSHAAILARSQGIPMLSGAGQSVLAVPNGTVVAFDGATGEFVVSPDATVLADFERRATERAGRRAAVQADAHRPARSRDGVLLEVTANIGSLDDAKAAADAYADGAGLVRTEFLFHTRAEPPSQGEQESIYRSIADAFGGRRVVFRTLDAGGDKPLPFAPVGHESNPYLGVRGIRLSLRHRALLLDQLTALVRVAEDAPISVMFPMVSSLDELLQARSLLNEAAGGTVPERLQVGIMVEVPAAALKAATFADHVDFFSIGTNDLTQYTLAAERGNPAVAHLSDPLDPGVLQLISSVCDQAAGRAKVSVCGEVASDPTAVGILVGLGVESLSVSVPAIAEIKHALRGLDHAKAASTARRALGLADGRAVRELAKALR